MIQDAYIDDSTDLLLFKSLS